MIKINVDKARDIAHDYRREARAAEFKPLDVQATIPMFAEVAEGARQIVRAKYSDIQDKINEAADVAELTRIVKDYALR